MLGRVVGGAGVPAGPPESSDNVRGRPRRARSHLPCSEAVLQSVDSACHNPNTPPPATPLVTGQTIRLPGHHAKVRRDSYIGHRRGGPAPAAATQKRRNAGRSSSACVCTGGQDAEDLWCLRGTRTAGFPACRILIHRVWWSGRLSESGRSRWPAQRTGALEMVSPMSSRNCRSVPGSPLPGLRNGDRPRYGARPPIGHQR
jgi:hypothetical protein